MSMGWCPYFASTRFLASINELALLSHIVREKPYIRKAADEHDKCTETACALYALDLTTYSARHVDPTCHCANAAPPLQDIAKLLSSSNGGPNTVPTVHWDGMQLRVRPASDGQYVAISHVWADGLGSTSEVGLPACQIARLAELVKQLVPATGAFWMDSLCVPREAALRGRALKLLSRTYREAAKVLVLDAGIRAQCAKSKQWEENLFRIVTSGWARRVWTAQEAVLAQRLCFEYADGPVDVTDLLHTVSASDSVSRSPKPGKAPLANGNGHSADDLEYPEFNPASLYRSCFSVIALRSTLKGRPGHMCTIDEVMDLLRLRAATKREDEAMALAGLLPIDIDALLSLIGPDAAEHRMRATLQHLRTLPRRLPMLRKPRLNLAGFRWAPLSFTGTHEPVSGTDGPATCTSEGLLADYSFAKFESPVAIPPFCAQGLQEGFKIAIMQQGSTCIYEAVFSMPADHYRSGVSGLPLSVDGLIFIHDKLPKDSRIISCAAVALRTGSQVQEEGAGKGAVKCDYVASVEFWCSSDTGGAVEPRARAIAMTPDVYGLFTMGGLSNTRVLLR